MSSPGTRMSSPGTRTSSPGTSHRLRKHADYQRVYKAGRKQFRGQISFFFAMRVPGTEAALRSPTGGPRVGLTVPKALGKAVDRNRIKRRMREAVRASLALLTAPVDLVLHPRRSVLTTEFAVLQREVAEVFRSVQSAAGKSRTSSPAAPGPAPAAPPQSRERQGS